MKHAAGFTRFVEVAPGREYANEALPVPFANISERTGIRSRAIADPDETIESIGTQAVRRLFEELDIGGADCGGLVLATSALGAERDYASRAARRIAYASGIDAPSCGVNFACSGFPAAVERGMDMARATDRHVVVVASEIFSRMVNWREEATAVLFGDRAAATSLIAGGHEVLDAHARQVEDPEELIGMARGDNVMDARGETRRGECLRMNGKALYRAAPGAMVRLLRESAARADLQPGEVSAAVPHQANGRFMEKIAKILSDKHAGEGGSWEHLWVVNEIERMANVGSASIPSALARVQDNLLPGTAVICPAIGAGPSFRSGLLTEGVLTFRVSGERL